MRKQYVVRLPEAERASLLTLIGRGAAPARAQPHARILLKANRGEAGIWDRLLTAVQQEADTAGEVDWSVAFVDGTVIRAHQHAAGAKGGRQKRRRSDEVRVVLVPRSTSRRMVPASL